jgi:hypothetical protein
MRERTILPPFHGHDAVQPAVDANAAEPPHPALAKHTEDIIAGIFQVLDLVLIMLEHVEQELWNWRKPW